MIILGSALVLIALLTFWTWQKRSGYTQQLVAEGFQITDDLKGDPKLLVDRQGQQLALITNKGIRKISFSEISRLESMQDAGIQVEEKHRIHLILNSGEDLAVFFESAELRDSQLKRLNQLLFD